MRVISIDTSSAFHARLAAALDEAATTVFVHVASVAEARVALAEAPADVAVAGPSAAVDEVLELASEQTADPDGAAVLLVASQVDTELMRRAMRAGVADAIAVEGQTYASIAQAVRDVFARLDRARLAETPAPESAASHRGRVITVFSTKGGVGKSVLASNIGVALASDARHRVVLVDLDLQFGDSGIMLGLEPAHTIYDATQVIDRLDAEKLSGCLVAHGSGLKVLLAPVRPEDAESVTAARVARVIDLLAEMVDYVVIDTAAALDEVVLTAIDKSDTVCAVATMDVASVKNTRVSLQKLAQLGYRDGLVRLVLNRADSKVWLEAAEIERVLQRPIAARIPSDRLVPRSVNKGTPVVIDAPKSAVAHSIVDLAERLAGDDGRGEDDVAHGQARGD